MGDRAVIIFHDKGRQRYSPTIYLHWAGHRVGELVAKLKERMADRLNDVDYAAARFVGLAHESIEGALSLGIWDKPTDFEDEPEYLTAFSHGDAGTFLVDVSTWDVRTFGGYGLTEAA